MYEPSKLLFEMRKWVRRVLVLSATRHGLLFLPYKLICSPLCFFGSAKAAGCIIRERFIIEERSFRRRIWWCRNGRRRG